MIEAISALDANILLWVQENLRCDVLTAIFTAMSWITTLGAVWIVTALVLVCIKKTRWAGVYTLCTMAVEYVANDLIIKKLVARPRPYEVIENLTVLVPLESSFSFPSGHAAVSFAAAFAITVSCGKKGAWAYLPATIIALSRIYVGVHNPSDVLGGMIVGTLVGLLVYLIVRYAMKKKFPLMARG